MLFNSYTFLIFFLPITLGVFIFLQNKAWGNLHLVWLVSLSLLFYGYWNPKYLILLISSMLVNFGFGKQLSLRDGACAGKKTVLMFGIMFNLGLIGYFKYANFLVDNTNALFSTELMLPQIVLPLAISFFTFQQITYLVDTYKGITHEHKFIHYALYVSFFPQLIAGPIVHHSELIPQILKNHLVSYKNIALGVSIFSIGLFKKVIIADSISVWSDTIFSGVSNGLIITLIDAWIGALAYTFQLYFDFSGYADMAIGLGLLFGVRLPINFNSPYKAYSIIDFWRRWHITLSRFLRDYLYIPLGGSKHGNSRRYLNLGITMLLGGIWHGAGWTFIFWGALHGMYLLINHAWSSFVKSHSLELNSMPWKIVFRLLTLLAIIVGWVFFRAENFSTAISMLQAMFGLNGISLELGWAAKMQPIMPILNALSVRFEEGATLVPYSSSLLTIFLLAFICLKLPNTQQIFRNVLPLLVSTQHISESQIGTNISWEPTFKWYIFIVGILSMSILSLTRISEFLYFQF